LPTCAKKHPNRPTKYTEILYKKTKKLRDLCTFVIKQINRNKKSYKNGHSLINNGQSYCIRRTGSPVYHNENKSYNRYGAFFDIKSA